jgi:hypothetical protein
MVALVAAMQACGPTETIDRIPTLEFGGRTYDIGYAAQLDIQPPDLTPIGESQEFPLAAGRVIMALRGLDDADVIILKSARDETVDYLIGFARGSIPDAVGGESDEDAARRLLVALPGLCEYHMNPPPGSCG